jgi:hypothetical protein
VSAVRLPAGLTSAVDKWAEDHEANRSEAIRRLVELGLTIKTKAKQPSAAGADRAKELAAKAIDKMIDRPRRRRSAPSADAASPRDHRSFVRLALISQRRRGVSDDLEEMGRSPA